MSTELAPASPEFTARFRRSAAAFRRFFEELAAHYLEREHVLAQIQLALLSREHVLVFGPPGTAKSELALNVVRRIVDDASGEASLFSKQIAETTVQTDIIGPVDYKTLTETGRTEHLTDEGILGAVHGVLDEVFDGREMMLRSILNVLQEREVKSGRKTVRGRNEVAIMTSNRYLSEVVQRNPELMLAFADRVAYVSFVPKGFAHRESRAAMLQRAARRMRPDLQARLTIQDVDILQEAAEAVEVPEGVLAGLERLAELLERELASHAAEDSAFLPTKYFSNRTLVRSLLALKAAVVRSATLAPRAWPLKASLDDLAHLQAFFTLAGPSVVDLAALQQAASDRREKVQLAISRTEAVAFAECLARTLQSMAGGQPFKARERKLGELCEQASGLAQALVQAEAEELAKVARHVDAQAKALAELLSPAPRYPGNTVAVTGAVRRLGEALLECLERPALPLASVVPLLLSTARLANAARTWSGLGRLFGQLTAVATSAAVAATNRLVDAQRALELAATTKPTLEELTRRVSSFAQSLEAVEDGMVELASELPVASDAVAEVEKASGRARESLAQGAIRQARWVLAALPRSPGLAGLTEDYRRLAALETALRGLAPAAGSPREAIFGERVEQVLLSAIPEGGSLWQVFESLRQVSSELRAAGSDPSQHVPRLSKVLRARVQAALEGPRSAPPVATPEGGGEERAAAYRRRFPAHPGAFRSLQAIEQALAGAGEAVAPLVTEDVAERLAAEDLRQVEARLQLLEEWLGQEREAVRAQLSLLRSTEQASALQKQLSEGHLAKLILEEREADAILDELKALSVRRPVAPESFERAAALRDAMHALAGEVLEARSRLIDFGKMGPARMNL